MYEVWKMLLDKVLASIAVLLYLPVLLIVAVLIKLTSKGPVFVRQTRLGKNAKPFTLFKFRTMYTGDNQIYAQDFVKNLIAGEYGEIGKDPLLKLVNDPRVTPLGRFLRKTSFDEFPQFINVLRGDMSIVGPRPPLPFEYELYEEWHKERLSVKPGITGLWQIEGRSRSTFDEMIKLDIKYARQRSILLDLKIIFKTPSVVLSGKGAY